MIILRDIFNYHIKQQKYACFKLNNNKEITFLELPQAEKKQVKHGIGFTVEESKSLFSLFSTIRFLY